MRQFKACVQAVFGQKFHNNRTARSKVMNILVRKVRQIIVLPLLIVGVPYTALTASSRRG